MSWSENRKGYATSMGVCQTFRTKKLIIDILKNVSRYKHFILAIVHSEITGLSLFKLDFFF